MMIACQTKINLLECVLRKPIILILVIYAAPLIMADIGLSYVLSSAPAPGYVPSSSVRQSKSRGIFLQQFKTNPAVLDGAKGKLSISECWVEKQPRISHVIVLVPFIWHLEYYHATEKRLLCMTFSNADHENSASSVSFSLQSQNRSFDRRDTYVWLELSVQDSIPIYILCGTELRIWLTPLN